MIKANMHEFCKSCNVVSASSPADHMSKPTLIVFFNSSTSLLPNTEPDLCSVLPPYHFLPSFFWLCLFISSSFSILFFMAISITLISHFSFFCTMGTTLLPLYKDNENVLNLIQKQLIYLSSSFVQKPCGKS